MRRRIEALAPGGRYILASANSLPNYVKPENVRAMGESLLQHGTYTERLKARTRPQTPAPPKTPQPATAAPQPPRQPDSPIHAIRNAIIGLDRAKMGELVRRAIAAGCPAEQIIQEGFIRAMDQVGKSFAANTIFVPEMMVSAMTMKEGLDMVKPLLQGKGAFSRGRVLLATVKGDLHDIGKNIVGMMLEGAGFEVIDLGINIDSPVILREVQELQPKALGLSALLTTTMPEMARVIQSLHSDGLRTQVKVMVGGAPLSSKFASEIGADGYAADAASAVDLCRRLTDAL